jgi:hypothetical protein
VRDIPENLSFAPIRVKLGVNQGASDLSELDADEYAASI